MKSSLLFIYAFFCATLFAVGADPKYPVSEIPANLKNGVNVVVRENTTTFTIVAKDKATYHVHIVITILNEQGKAFGSEVVGYDKLTKIREFSGSVYDGSGKLIKRLKNSEIYDQSAFDGVTLFSDNRLKAANLTQGTYPYTVDFEYDIEFKYLFQIPTFELLSREKMSVAKATYILEYPTALKPKYRLQGIEQNPQIEKTSEITERLRWDFKDILPIRAEPHGPARESLFPKISAAPSNFEYADYVGSMNTWDEFGQWIAALNKGRDQLPENTQQKIKSLTAGLTGTEEKTKALYQYLQNKTRYVGIQLGIGGYQPFEASVVDETGYGDCKALSNYMVSMLKVAGIKAHYALIYAGSDGHKMKTDFVSSQFNHAVVAVPNGSDTLWLECTSQTSPFGYAGLFTGERKALLITETGATIAHTPRYTAEQNLQRCTADVVVDLSGNARAKVKTVYGGLQYENSNLDAILDNQYEEQKKWVLDNTKIPSFDLVGFKVSNQKDKIPSALVDLDLSLNRFATVSGKRIFLTPNLMNRNSYVPEPVENRKTAVVRRIAFTDVDTIRYRLPEGIYPEFLPEDIKVTSRFGEYEASFKIDQGSLLYTRKVTMKKGEFPASSYQEMVDFYRSISRADNTKMVFMSKT